MKGKKEVENHKHTIFEGIEEERGPESLLIL